MEALEKFMKALNMTYSVEIDKNYYTRGNYVVCVKVEVKRDENREYLQYHCYTLKRDGTPKYDEGNEVKGIQHGVLTYLGMDREIDDYFEQKSRELAKHALSKSNW